MHACQPVQAGSQQQMDESIYKVIAHLNQSFYICKKPATRLIVTLNFLRREKQTVFEEMVTLKTRLRFPCSTFSILAGIHCPTVVNVTPLIYCVRIVMQPIFHCKSITARFFFLTCWKKQQMCLHKSYLAACFLFFFYFLVAANKSRCLCIKAILFNILKIHFYSICLRFSLSK